MTTPAPTATHITITDFHVEKEGGDPEEIERIVRQERILDALFGEEPKQ